MLKKWIVSVMSVAVVGFGGMTAVHADHSGTKNCGDFDSAEEVWEFWHSHGYHADNDPSGLDRDSDGWPCENLTTELEDQFLSYQADIDESDPEPDPDPEPDNNGNNENEENNNNNANHNNSDNNNNHNENNNNNSDNNHAEDVNNDNHANEEEGNELAATSTANPTLVLFGVILAGLGGVMMMRRKSAEA